MVSIGVLLNFCYFRTLRWFLRKVWKFRSFRTNLRSVRKLLIPLQILCKILEPPIHPPFRRYQRSFQIVECPIKRWIGSLGSSFFYLAADGVGKTVPVDPREAAAQTIKSWVGLLGFSMSLWTWSSTFLLFVAFYLNGVFCQLDTVYKRRVDSINPKEDVARPSKLWASLLGYLMGLTIVTLKSKFCKFNAPDNIVWDMIDSIE